MTEESESVYAYYRTLERELNPSIFVTEWMGQKLWNVELAMHSGSHEVVRQCVLGIQDFLEVRSWKDDYVGNLIAGAPATAAVKSEFRRAFDSAGANIESRDLKALMILSVYCFLHAAFEFD